MSGSIKNNQSILSNITNSQVIRYQNLNDTQTYITGIVLTNQNKNTGFQKLQFPQDGVGVLRNAYVHYSVDFFYLSQDQIDNKLTAWYRNYNTSVNTSSVFFSGKMSLMGPPTPAGLPISIQSTITGLVISATINLSPPTNVNSLDLTTLPDNTTYINEYKIDYEPLGSTIRYGGPILHSGSVVNTSNNNISITNLNPDCSYTITCYAKNNIDPNYSLGSPTQIITTNYLSPVEIGKFNFKATTYSAKLVANNNVGDLADTIVNNIFFSMPSFPWESDITNSQY